MTRPLAVNLKIKMRFYMGKKLFSFERCKCRFEQIERNSCSWIGWLSIIGIVDISFLPKLMWSPNNLPFSRARQIDSKVHTEKKKHARIVRKILEKKSYLPDIIMYLKVSIIKTMWYWHRIDQQNRIRSWGTDLNICGNLVHNKGISTHWAKNLLLNKCCEDHTRINFRVIKNVTH